MKKTTYLPMLLSLFPAMFLIHFSVLSQNTDTLIALVEDATGKRQYINLKAEVIIVGTGGNESDFSEDLVRKAEGKKFGFVDWKNNWIIKPQFKRAGRFSEGYAKVYDAGGWGFINKKGEVVIQHKFDAVLDFSEGVAAVKSKTFWGFMDTAGNYIIDPLYKRIDDFKNGYAAVIVGIGKWILIDKSGKTVLEPDRIYSFISDFSDGRIRARTGDIGTGYWWGYIDSLGNQVIPQKYIHAEDFSEGLARVRENKKWGYIDVNGKYVIKPAYDDCKDFSEGLARVNINNLWGVIDKQGNLVIEPRYQDIRSFSERVAAAKENGKWGYIDTNGRWIIVPQYKSAREFIKVKL